MNSTENVNTETLTRDAALNSLLYFDFDVEDGATVNEIIAQIHENEANLSENDLRALRCIEGAIENDPSMGQLFIDNQTAHMNDPATGLPFEEGGIKACTFQDSLLDPQQVTVTYMGTNGGEWVDNGYGLSGDMISTPQQDQAVNYFDAIVQANGWDENSPYIHLTGHSKGGNKVQFVIMNSQYSYLISEGYSLDGQSMSPEEIAYLKKVLGEEEFERRRNKLYSFAADNDYVNILGVTNDGRLVPDDHIFFLKSNLIFEKWHFADCFLNEDGTLTEFTDQGIVSKYLQNLSEQVMILPPPFRGIVTNGIMTILQLTMGSGCVPVNGAWAGLTGWDKAKMIAQALPMVVGLLKTALIDSALDAIENTLKKFGIDVDLSWISNVLTILYSISGAIAGVILGVVVDIAHFVVDMVSGLIDKIKGVCDALVDFFRNCIDGLANWFNRTFNAGYRYAEDHPEIKIDTAQMRNFAQRLQAVNRRIVSVDRRLDNMYYRVGLLDLWNLMKADLLTGYSWRLDRCANYLNDTAEEFERVENELKGLLGG